MKLWTVQPFNILEEIEQTGTYRCNAQLSFNLSKENSLKRSYQWLMEKMEEKIGKKPEGVDYPIWAWHTWKFERKSPDPDSAAFLQRNEDKVLLTLEVPDDEVVLTDFDAWQSVMNESLLVTETDPEKMDALEEYIDTLNEEQLQAFIQESWNNVFNITKADTPDYQRGKYIQATFWQLKKEYIIQKEVIRK